MGWSPFEAALETLLPGRDYPCIFFLPSADFGDDIKTNAEVVDRRCGTMQKSTFYNKESDW